MEKFEVREPVVLQNKGQKIFGMIHRPNNVEKCPFVLVCHGLGGNKCGKGRLYVHLSERLSKLGIGSLRIDFRGSGDSEGEFSSMTIDSEVSDATVALNFLKNDPNVNNESIAIFGRSFGGVVAVLAAKRFINIKSMALWAPVFGCEQWKEQWIKAQTASMAGEGGLQNHFEIEGLRPGYSFFEQLFALKLNEPLKELEEIPLLHIHGEKDTIVDLTHAHKYKEARLHVPGKSHFRLLPKSDHDFTDYKERHAALDETAEWFAATLKS